MSPQKTVIVWVGAFIFGTMGGIGMQLVHAWIGPSAAPPGGNVAGPITTQGDQTKNGKLYVKTTADSPNFPAGWGGGIASYDFYADRGSFGAGYDGSINFSANRDGTGYYKGVVTTGGLNSTGRINATVNDWGLALYGAGWAANASPANGVGSVYANDMYVRAAGRWVSQMPIGGVRVCVDYCGGAYPYTAGGWNDTNDIDDIAYGPGCSGGLANYGTGHARTYICSKAP